MKVLLFDNYDSFTYNLLHILRELGVSTEVYRNDRIALDEVERFDKIILSPGPGIPEEAGILLPLIRRSANRPSVKPSGPHSKTSPRSTTESKPQLKSSLPTTFSTAWRKR